MLTLLASLTVAHAAEPIAAEPIAAEPAADTAAAQPVEAEADDALAGDALAQSTETAPTPAPSSTQPVRARPYLMEVNVRGRYLGVPASLFDIWYYNDTDDGGTHLPRPQARAWSVGLEYVVKNDTQNGVFYFDYVGNLMEGGYWDDREDPPDYFDGDYVVPDRLSLLTLGADYYYELHATQWLSFMFGAGLGVAVVTGNLQKWDGDDGVPSYEIYAQRPDDPDDVIAIPKVLPVVDINAAIKFDINHRANIRLEGGFHNLLYTGAAVGIIF
ncbi:hypothetical protein L6R49_03355 [Myxococcota bacterium]|nr:hypothetical protein [Myxococcota bacterium]